jgi:hypothetical protein
MNRQLQAGDKVLYKSRKTGGRYIGFYGAKWTNKYGRDCVSVYNKPYTKGDQTVQLANPYIEDVQLLTEELHMLHKLENL